MPGILADLAHAYACTMYCTVLHAFGVCALTCLNFSPCFHILALMSPRAREGAPRGPLGNKGLMIPRARERTNNP